jgi:hypothetical protein
MQRLPQAPRPPRMEFPLLHRAAHHFAHHPAFLAHYLIPYAAAVHGDLAGLADALGWLEPQLFSVCLCRPPRRGRWVADVATIAESRLIQLPPAEVDDLLRAAGLVPEVEP